VGIKIAPVRRIARLAALAAAGAALGIHAPAAALPLGLGALIALHRTRRG